MENSRYEKALAEANKLLGNRRMRKFFMYARRFGKPTDAAALERLVVMYRKGMEVRKATRTRKDIKKTLPGESTVGGVQGISTCSRNTWKGDE